MENVEQEIRDSYADMQRELESLWHQVDELPSVDGLSSRLRANQYEVLRHVDAIASTAKRLRRAAARYGSSTEYFDKYL